MLFLYCVFIFVNISYLIGCQCPYKVNVSGAT